MKKHFILLMVTGLLITTFSCKKYDDGPAVSLLTKKGRLDGSWTIVLVLQNEADVTAFYPVDLGYNFDKNGNYKKTFNGVTTTGTWAFNSDKTEILLTVAASPDADAWKILRLTNRHLWWKRTVGGEVIEEHYEVKKN